MHKYGLSIGVCMYTDPWCRDKNLAEKLLGVIDPTQRLPHRTKLAGGGKEYDIFQVRVETPLEAFKREVLEELGLDITNRLYAELVYLGRTNGIGPRGQFPVDLFQVIFDADYVASTVKKESNDGEIVEHTPIVYLPSILKADKYNRKHAAYIKALDPELYEALFMFK